MAKRRLSNFNFETEGSHIALVHKDQGGPANGHDYALICKATKDLKESDVEKAAEVTVTMSMVDFLCKFYNLWYEDAIVLAAIFGYQDIEDAYSFTESAEDYEKYLQEKVDAVQIMKSLVMDKELPEITKAVGELSAKDYLTVLKCQETFEKNYEQAVQKAASYKKASVENAEELAVEKSTKSPSVENNKNGDTMSEFVTKAVHEAAVQEAVEKAKGEFQVELQKALDKVAEYEKAQKEAVEKSRKEAIAAVEADKVKAEELFKSLESLSEEAFASVIKALGEKNKQVEESDLFVQKSKQMEVEEPKEENATAVLLKQKYAKQ